MKKLSALLLCVMMCVAALHASAPRPLEGNTPRWIVTVMDIYCESPCENILYCPPNYQSPYQTTITSSDPAVAEYDETNQCVVGHKAGTAIITASFTANYDPVSVTVNVIVPQATSKDGNVLTFDKEKFRVTLDGSNVAFYLPGSQTDDYSIPGKVSYGSTVYTVNKIAAGGMKGKDVRTVTIPYTVTEIGDEAFAECYSLTKLPYFGLSNVTVIGDKAFYDCRSLQNTDMPVSLTSIGSFAFAECYALTTFMFEANVSHIGDGAFADCLNMQCFDERSNPYLTVMLPDDMGGPGILLTADGKELIAYPNKIREHYDIFGFTDPYVIDRRVQTIRPYAFSGCTSLRGVTIPATVKSIGAYAFQGCPGIQSITLPASITRIEEGTFTGCEGLASVDAPATLTYVGANAFPANAPKDFTIRAITPPAIARSAQPEMFSSLPSGATLHVPAGTEEAYKAAAVWNYYPIIAGFGTNGVSEVEIGAEACPDSATEVFTTAGIYVGSTAEGLPAGLYIVRKGGEVTKISVR